VVNTPSDTPLSVTAIPLLPDAVKLMASLPLVPPTNRAVRLELNGSVSTATGMTIDPNSGLISWMPNGTGSITVTVVATDTSNLTATLSYTLTIHSDIPPLILSTAPTSVTAGLPYQYDIVADAPGGYPGDTLSYTLVPLTEMFADLRA
jgi:hypothetical protein